MAEQDFDQAFMIQRIKESIPENISFVDEIAELLNVTNDSAYRRIRGETNLTIKEIAAICKHFKFSFDAFIGNTDNNMVSFSYNRLGTHANAFKEYLTNIKNDLTKIMMLPEQEREIVFGAEDIPIFHHFAHPYLTAFKIFYWNRSILNTTGYEDKKFDNTHIDGEVIKIAEDIYDLYSRINSKEVWADDTVNSTIKQIDFYWESGVFNSKEDALKVCEEVNAMFSRIRKQAELNIKLDKNNNPAATEQNYELYHSDIMIGTNCVLTSMREMKNSYISYHTFNTMRLINADFSSDTDFWLKNIISKSNRISGIGEKQRYLFFKDINDKLNRLVEKIQRN